MARILVIDDDDLVRGTVEAMLEAGGHEATLAVDGEDGLRQFQRQPFDLVLCDVFMPQKEGLETVRELLRDDADHIDDRQRPRQTQPPDRSRPPAHEHCPWGYADDRQAVAPNALLDLVRECLGPAGWDSAG